MYWANKSGNAIGRARLDRTAPAQPAFIPSGVTDPRGVVAIDSSLYFTHVSSGGKVGRVNRDGSGAVQSNFVIGGTGADPCGLGFFSDRIMFANQGVTGSIGRSHGMFPETQNFITQTANPCGVVSADGFVYWANQGSDSIGRANFDGSGAARDWLPLTAGTMPCAIAIDNGRIYWTSVGLDKIGRADIGPSGPANVNEDLITTGVDESCGLTTSPTVQADPATGSFAETAVGSQSDGIALFLANRSSASLDVATVSLTGADPGDFEITDGCTGNFSLAGCLINARFAPTAEGQRTATLRVVTNAGNSPTEIPLSGTGVAPPAQPPAEPPSQPPAEPPPAEPKLHDRTLSISHSARAERFKGALAADEPACAAGQSVKVFKRRRGADRRVGTDRTSGDGRWRIDGDVAEGRYYADAAAVLLANGDTCGAARSRTIRAG